VPPACTHFDGIVNNALALLPDWAAGTLLVGAAAVSGRDWGAGRGYQIAG
jgi:hypothetical protein